MNIISKEIITKIRLKNPTQTKTKRYNGNVENEIITKEYLLKISSLFL
jgi:hypothetical protein